MIPYRNTSVQKTALASETGNIFADHACTTFFLGDVLPVLTPPLKLRRWS